MVDKPLRADAERNRRRLLEAASELFAQKGLSVGLDEIARHAGVGVGTAYRRFPDKDQLIWALFEERVKAIVAVADEGLAMDDPWEGFVHFMYGAVALQIRDRGLKELVFGHVRGEDRVALGRAEIAPRVVEIVRRAQEAGVLRADLGVPDVPMVQFMVSGLAGLGGGVGDEIWPRFVGIILDGMRTPDPTPLPRPPLTLDEWQEVMRTTGFSRSS